MRISWLFLVSILGASAIIMGAVGAHVVHGDDVAEGRQNTALMYHMFGLLPMMIAVYLRDKSGGKNRLATASVILSSLGVICFSGSLYFLAWSGTSLGFNITPAGGLLLIGGWLVLAAASLKKADPST
ncbi:MAG: DUF423 domain-containing protein [Proteobacteria bacterium]|nr:DUF423 domain-containing protein [Pseudomonadota bacterium]